MYDYALALVLSYRNIMELTDPVRNFPPQRYPTQTYNNHSAINPHISRSIAASPSAMATHKPRKGWHDTSVII